MTEYPPVKIQVNMEKFERHPHFKPYPNQLLVINEAYLPFTQWGDPPPHYIDETLPQNLFIPATGPEPRGYALVHGTVAIYVDLPQGTNLLDIRREHRAGRFIWHRTYKDDKIGEEWDKTHHINELAAKLAAEYNCQRYSCSTGLCIGYIRRGDGEREAFEIIQNGKVKPRPAIDGEGEECTLCRLGIHEADLYDDETDQIEGEIQYYQEEIAKKNREIQDLEEDLKISTVKLRELKAKTPKQVWDEKMGEDA